MSELKKISTADVLPGDVVRQVLLPTSGPATFEGCELVAVEVFARTAGGGLPWSDACSETFLIERPVVLPTRPYSLVVPPATERARLYGYVLEPDPYTDARWSRVGKPADIEEVLRAVRDLGWLIIDGPEVLP